MSDEHDSWLSGIGINVDSVLDSVQNTASNFVESVQNTVSSATDASFGEAVEGIASAAAQVVSSTAQNVRQGVSNAVNQARNAANKVVDSVVESASGAAKSVGEAAGKAMDSAGEFVEEAMDSADEISAEDISALLADLSAADDANVSGGGSDEGGGGSRADRDRGIIDSLSVERPDFSSESGNALTRGLAKVAEQMFKEFRASPAGKRIEEFAGKEFEKIPTSAKIIVPAVLLSGALAGVVARGDELPITESPDIPLPDLGPVKVSGKITWKGPLDKPRESSITFNFEISLDGPGPTRALEQSDRRGGASGGSGSRNFRPVKEGATVLIANFNFGKFNLDRIPRDIARRPDGKKGRVDVVVFYASPPDSDDEETQRQKNADFQDLATERSQTLKRALEQLMPGFRVTAGIQPIERAFDEGLKGNCSVFFTPQLN